MDNKALALGIGIPVLIVIITIAYLSGTKARNAINKNNFAPVVSETNTGTSAVAVASADSRNTSGQLQLCQQEAGNFVDLLNNTKSDPVWLNPYLLRGSDYSMASDPHLQVAFFLTASHYSTTDDVCFFTTSVMGYNQVYGSRAIAYQLYAGQLVGVTEPGLNFLPLEIARCIDSSTATVASPSGFYCIDYGLLVTDRFINNRYLGGDVISKSDFDTEVQTYMTLQ